MHPGGGDRARGSAGPLFIQGDHFQTNAEEVSRPTAEKELATPSTALIDEAIAAGFYNIDIDTSTLVDLSTADARGAAGGQLRALRAASRRFIREHEPEGRHDLGRRRDRRGRRQNSTPEEFRAYMNGYHRNAARARDGGDRKISSRPARRTAASSLPDGTVGEGGDRLRRAHARSPTVAREGVRPGRRRAARRLDAAGRGLRRLPDVDRLPRSTSRPSSRTWSTTTRRSRPT